MRHSILIVLFVVAGCASQPATQPARSTPGLDGLISELAADATREEARRRLIALGAESVPAIVEYARDSRTIVRWELAHVLGAIGDARALPALVTNATADENVQVRARSLWGLAHFDTETVKEALRDRLEDPVEAVRWNAAVALSQFGAADGLNTLHAGVRHPDPWRRWEAINALGRVHDETSVNVLAATLRSPAPGDRMESVLTLGLIGGPKATAMVVGALDDDSADVRARACMALGKLRDASTLPALRARQGRETDARVREQLMLTIDSLTSR